MSFNPCKDCRMIPSVQYGIVSNIAYVRCKCGKTICGNETAETEWNESNPLPANFQQGCRDSEYLIEIAELKKQLENERKKNMWSIPVNVLNGNVCNKQVKIKKLEAELENKRQKIERQRAELQKLNERLTRHCAGCQNKGAADMLARDDEIKTLRKELLARAEKISSLEKLLKTQGEVFSENDVATWKCMADVRRAVREWDRCVAATEKA